MGKVYEALDTRLDPVVAIKLSAERFGERFEREARAVASLNHPYIFGETGRPFSMCLRFILAPPRVAYFPRPV